MDAFSSLLNSWAALPNGAAAALQEQWIGLAAGGLACGAAVVDRDGRVLASGRNHAYDPPGPIHSRGHYALQHTRLAHAELNALARVATEVDHSALTLWSTQHPCAMCAAALSFVEIGRVAYIAADLSDDSGAERIVASRGAVHYDALGDPLWWTISNLLFLHNPAVRAGEEARSVRFSRTRCPALADLVLDLAREDALGKAARAGKALPAGLAPYLIRIYRCAEEVLR
jgi:tRNA(Arg) A34 adenosine deaminase TadA